MFVQLDCLQRRLDVKGQKARTAHYRAMQASRSPCSCVYKYGGATRHKPELVEDHEILRDSVDFLMRGCLAPGEAATGQVPRTARAHGQTEVPPLTMFSPLHLGIAPARRSAFREVVEQILLGPTASAESRRYVLTWRTVQNHQRSALSGRLAVDRAHQRWDCAGPGSPGRS